MDNKNITFSYNSSQDNSTVSQPSDSQFGALGYFLAGITFFGVFVCWTLNAIVIFAINRTRLDRIKVRFLMKNAIAGDILLSISFGARVVFQLAGIDDQDDGLTFVALCANTLYDLYAYFSTFYQIFSSMALAVDRFYSVLRPLTYHTMNYNTPVKALSILFIFCLASAVALPVILLKLEPGDDIMAACHKATLKGEYTEEFLPYFILLAVVVTLCIHCSVLIVIAYHRRQIDFGEQESQRFRRKEVPLAITFFFINLTFVLFYIPGALYFSIITENMLSKPILNFYLSQVVIIIYQLNTIVDPLIYIFRIRSVRFSVKQMLCIRKSKTYKKSGRTAESLGDTDRPTSVATISAF